MNQRRIGTWALSLLMAVALLGMPGGASGQNLSDLVSQTGSVQVVAPSPTPRTFGTAGQTAHVIGASAFDVISNTGTLGYVGTSKFAGAGMLAPVRLPAGAVVSRVELEGCDTSATNEIIFVLLRTPSPNGSFVGVTPQAGTGGAQMPGCDFFSVTPSSPLIIDNENNTYAVNVFAPTSTTTVTAVRIYYTLQVSPAPAVASFNDVPSTHPFFRYIEALKASGITGGCQANPPLFCPDAPLTRGQMATFLSIALGLHFAP